MKIISKYKDYYDYLQGIYGIDKVLVYDRRTTDLIRHEKSLQDYIEPFEFHICNKKYTIYWYKNKFYHTPKELKILNKILFDDGKETLCYVSNYYDYKKEDLLKFWNKNNGDSMVNKKFRIPILIESSCGEIFDEKDDKNRYSIPLLKSFQFHRWLSAEECFLNISAFLGWLKDNPEIPNKQTNKEKIVSHGFDFKKSFRHRM